MTLGNITVSFIPTLIYSLASDKTPQVPAHPIMAATGKCNVALRARCSHPLPPRWRSHIPLQSQCPQRLRTLLNYLRARRESQSFHTLAPITSLDSAGSFYVNGTTSFFFFLLLSRGKVYLSRWRP